MLSNTQTAWLASSGWESNVWEVSSSPVMSQRCNAASLRECSSDFSLVSRVPVNAIDGSSEAASSSYARCLRPISSTKWPMSVSWSRARNGSSRSSKPRVARSGWPDRRCSMRSACSMAPAARWATMS